MTVPDSCIPSTRAGAWVCLVLMAFFGVPVLDVVAAASVEVTSTQVDYFELLRVSWCEKAERGIAGGFTRGVAQRW